MRNKWSKEICYQIALNYNTRIEFKTFNCKAYRAATKYGWLFDICKHMKANFKPHNYWNKEMCKNIALKYTNRADFRKYDYDAYFKSAKYHWLDEISVHMIKTGNIKHRCIYVYEFPDNNAYVGLTHNLISRNNRRKLVVNDAVTKHIKDSGFEPTLKQLSEYVCVDIAKILEKECIIFYRKLGWDVLNVTKGGEIGCGKLTIFTKNECHVKSLKYKTRTKFKETDYSAYMFARENNWLDDICSHMVLINTNRSIDSCKVIALKYNTKTEFEANDKATYSWAYRHHILDEICIHMTRKFKPSGYWTYDKCKEEASKYTNKNLFLKCSGGAVDAAKRNGWYDEICSYLMK